MQDPGNGRRKFECEKVVGLSRKEQLDWERKSSWIVFSDTKVSEKND